MSESRIEPTGVIEKLVHVTRENGDVVEVTKETRVIGKGKVLIGGVVIAEFSAMRIEEPIWKKKGRGKR